MREGLRGLQRWTAARDRRIALAVVLLMLGIFGITAGGHTYSGDEEGYYQQAKALSTGTYAFPLSEDVRFVSAWRFGRDGLATGGGGIGASAAAVPLALVGRVAAATTSGIQRDEVVRVFVGFTNPIIGALLVGVCFLLARQLGASRRDGVLLAIIIGVGTLVWSYAHQFLFSELLTALFLCAAVLVAIRATRAAAWWLGPLAGVLGVGAVFARATAAPFVILIGLYVLATTWRRRGWHSAIIPTAGYVGGVIMAGLLLLLANWWRYGDTSDVGYGQAPFELSVWDGLNGLLLSPGKSVFIYAPVAVVALIAVPWSIRRYPAEISLLLAIALVNLLIFARFSGWSGDQAWGPRYMLIALPLLVLIAAPVLSGTPWRAAAATAGCIGVVIATFGIVVNPLTWFGRAAAEFGTEWREDVGQIAFIHEIHFSPASSQPVAHARLLPEAARSTAAFIDDPNGTDGRWSPLPARVDYRMGWHTNPVQLDAWWYWVLRRDNPEWLLLLLIPIMAAGASGGLMLGRVQ